MKAQSRVLGDFVEDVAGRAWQKRKSRSRGDRKSSLFRIHRDVRFSANKESYKTQAGVVLTRSGNKNDPGLIYSTCRPTAARAPKPFKAMLAKLRKAGLPLSAEDSLKRAPRGFEAIDDPEIAAAARLKSLVCLRPAPETAVASSALVDDFCAFARDALPLLKWGWDATADLRSRPPRQ